MNKHDERIQDSELLREIALMMNDIIDEIEVDKGNQIELNGLYGYAIFSAKSLLRRAK